MNWFRRRGPVEPEQQPLTVPVHIAINGIQHQTSLTFDPESSERAEVLITHGHIETAHQRGRELTLLVWDVS